MSNAFKGLATRRLGTVLTLQAAFTGLGTLRLGQLSTAELPSRGLQPFASAAQRIRVHETSEPDPEARSPGDNAKQPPDTLRRDDPLAAGQETYASRGRTRLGVLSASQHLLLPAGCSVTRLGARGCLPDHHQRPFAAPSLPNVSAVNR